MPNAKNDDLFHLIKSLNKSEKRNFKLFMKRVSGSENFIIMQLFDAIDKLKIYDEQIILKKNNSIKKSQLPNLKAHLSKQLLMSLRMLNNHESIVITLSEQIHNAHIAYKKGLYLQSLKILQKAKTIGYAYHQHFHISQIIDFEKKIEGLHITHSSEHRAEQLTSEAKSIQKKLYQQSRLSDLALNMYNWYIKKGHAIENIDRKNLSTFFQEQLLKITEKDMTFYEKLYLYQANSWYYFILQRLDMFYKYTQKWYDLFVQNPPMQEVETDHFLKAFHNLLNALFDTAQYEKYNTVLNAFEHFTKAAHIQISINLEVQTMVYLYTAKMNKYFLEGAFTEGLAIVPELIKKIDKYQLYIDKHRVMIFYYKIACLYFGSGDNENAIKYLTKIINEKYEWRKDLQCYARLLHLIAHYELGNFTLIEYLLKSVYRFMAKMNHLNRVEVDIFKFLRNSFSLPQNAIIPAFKKLKKQLEQTEKNPLTTRSFMYLDIQSWLESKIRNVPVEIVVREHFELYKQKQRP